MDSATVSIFFFNIPNCNMGLDNSAYYRILKAHEWNPLSYKEIADSLMKNGVKQMYHAIVNEDDIQFLFSIPNLEIFWCCRCHLVAKDGSTAHEHLHALVQYQKGTHLALKKRMQRAKQRFHSKTTFKPIICPDHAVGVLRYICCEDGQRQKRRDGDGLSCKPHTHYCRSVYDSCLLHSRNQKLKTACSHWRMEITYKIWKELSDQWLNENVSGDDEYKLHHQESCNCENGDKGKKKKAAANKRRSDFYKTEEGQAKKRYYAEKASKKHELIRLLTKYKTGGKNEAELTKETIARLMEYYL